MGRLRNWAVKDLVRLRGELREGAQTIGDNSSENGGISSKKKMWAINRPIRLKLMVKLSNGL